MVAVIAALDLDDQIAPGQRPREVHGVHGGFGAGVGEPPQRQIEAAGQFARDPDGVLGRLGEMGSAPHPVAHRLDDRRMGMSGNRCAVAAVHVDVLVAVDVVDLEPLPWLIQTACGSAICQLDVAPPARCSPATAMSSVLRG